MFALQLASNVFPNEYHYSHTMPISIKTMWLPKVIDYKP